MNGVYEACEEATRFHDETSAVNNEDQMAGQSDIKVINRIRLPSMEDLLIRRNLRCTGHLLRMPIDRLPRQVLYPQLPEGQRARGRPRLHYKGTIKRNCKEKEY